MTRRGGFIFGALLFLLLGLFLIWLLNKIEPYQETLTHGPSPEARFNDYLAAESFLRKQGLRVSRADGLEVLADLPAPGHTLLLLADRSRMTPRQADRVLDWAAHGGHVLFVAEALYDEDEGESGDLLLDRLGIQQFETEDLDEEDSEDAEQSEATEGEEDAATEEGVESDAAEDDQQQAQGEEEAPAEADAEPEEEDRYPELTKLYLENEDAPAYIDFDTGFHLYDSEDRAHAWANSANATHMLQMNHGDGLITVLTDSWIWQNRNIVSHDNAWLLWYLTQDTEVTLLYRAERDDLPALLWRNFPEALVALALLIALVLWHVGRRQGPQLAPASRSRRQLEEHLRASADFLLRRSGKHVLLQGLQRDILRRARRRHPGFERLGVAEQWQVLSRLTRMPTAAISQAMRPLPRQRLSASEFTRQVAHLQSLRNAL